MCLCLVGCLQVCEHGAAGDERTRVDGMSSKAVQDSANAKSGSEPAEFCFWLNAMEGDPG